MKKIILVMLFLGMVGYVFAEPSVQVEPGTNIVSGKTTVVTANTPIVLGADTAILSVSLTWSSDSATSYVYVGSSSLTGNNGATITSGSVLTINVNNLNDIYINSSPAGGKVGYVAVVR